MYQTACEQAMTASLKLQLTFMAHMDQPQLAGRCHRIWNNALNVCLGMRSCSEGWSFIMDPLCPQPADPRWLAFCRAFTPWALAHGARTSLTQARTPLKPLVTHKPWALTRARTSSKCAHPLGMHTT